MLTWEQLMLIQWYIYNSTSAKGESPKGVTWYKTVVKNFITLLT